MVSARPIARRAKRLVGYWRSERRTLSQGLVALALSTAASFVAGLTLGSITGTLEALPGLLVLIPAAVGMRGTIFGAIGARLGTSVHAGLFEVTLRRDSVLGRNVEVAAISTITSSFYLAGLARLLSAALGQPSISFWDLVAISVVGGVIGSVAIIFVTVPLAIVGFRRGWDLDSVSTPMVTALGDMATLPSLFLATFLVRSQPVGSITAAVCAGATVAAIAWSVRLSAASVRRVLLEMTPIIVLTPLLDVLAGALLEARRASLGAVPGVLILVPPFVSQAGALGGILSSRIASKLAIGVIAARGRPGTPALVDAGIVAASGVVVFTLIGTLGLVLAETFGMAHPGATDMIGGTLIAGMLLLPITIAVGYLLAVGTARFGLDPDNFGVPVITSVMDLSGVAALLVVMSLSGVLAHG
jgi:mgtE-like transporter